MNIATKNNIEMNGENLVGAKKLFFTALWIDIAVTVVVVISSIWTIDVLKDIQSGQVTATESLVGSVGFWEKFAWLSFVTLIGVGLALVRWLDACYRYAKESIGASGFKKEWSTAIAWIIPILNTFMPYPIINEIYKAGSSGYRGADDWKKESGSGILLTWWIFWAVTHFIVWIVWKQVLQKSLNSDLTIPQVTELYVLNIGIGVLSIIVAVMWFFVANHLTGRLLGRKPLQDGFRAQPPASTGYSSHGDGATAMSLISGTPPPVQPMAMEIGSGMQPVQVRSAITGWSRIMVAITVAWFLALAGFIGYEHQRSSHPSCQFGGEDPVCQYIFWLWSYVAPEKFEFTLRHGRLLATALVPVAVLWFCFGAVVWVRAGFKTSPAPSHSPKIWAWISGVALFFIILYLIILNEAKKQNWWEAAPLAVSACVCPCQPTSLLQADFPRAGNRSEWAQGPVSEFT